MCCIFTSLLVYQFAVGLLWYRPYQEYILIWERCPYIRTHRLIHQSVPFGPIQILLHFRVTLLPTQQPFCSDITLSYLSLVNTLAIIFDTTFPLYSLQTPVPSSSTTFISRFPSASHKSNSSFIPRGRHTRFLLSSSPLTHSSLPFHFSNSSLGPTYSPTVTAKPIILIW